MHFSGIVFSESLLIRVQRRVVYSTNGSGKFGLCLVSAVGGIQLSSWLKSAIASRTNTPLALDMSSATRDGQINPTPG